jgi:hypothetical protein
MLQCLHGHEVILFTGTENAWVYLHTSARFIFLMMMIRVSHKVIAGMLRFAPLRALTCCCDAAKLKERVEKHEPMQ